MGIMRQKKKNLVLAAMLGLGVGIVPMGVATGIMSAKYIALNREYNEAKEGYSSYRGYVLDTEKHRGEIIGENDLKEVVYYSKYDMGYGSLEQLEGMALRQEGEEGIIVTQSMVYEDMGISDDLRMYMFDYIGIPENVQEGMAFDIRIAFPNGEDYIVAKGKTIEAKTEEGIFINATEEERLMISSAYVDTAIYSGAKIYASMYITDYQSLSVVNYPVNMYVTKLSDWNPNLVKELEDNQDTKKRKTLENNLYEFMGVTMGTAYYD